MYSLSAIKSKKSKQIQVFIDIFRLFPLFSAEFCSESSLWRLHAAHVLFMRGDKYKEAAAFYEPIVRQNYGDILSVSAAVLGNFVI